MIRNAMFFVDRSQRQRTYFAVCLSGLILLFAALTPVSAQAADTGKADFNFQVRPLLSDRCFFCHGPDSHTRKKKLRLDQPDGLFKDLGDGMAVVKPGDPDHSELIKRIFATDDEQMPPEDSHRTLSPAEKELLKRWVAEGAEYKPYWAFIPVQPVQAPKPVDPAWEKNPIDAFVLAKLKTENLPHSGPATRETLIRRVAFDLTGLPPTPAEVDSFLADTSTNAWQKVIGHYLKSPAYGERMTLDWLDLARYADTYGYQEDAERDMSPWRDWVIRSFNENMPYDRFLTWQIAGDMLPNPTRDQIIATAFNRLNRQTDEGGSIDEEFRAEYVSDRVNTVGTAVLGLTFACARCHDHKFDPITQADYYSLGAFFNSIDESGTYSHFTHATPGPALMLWPEDKSGEAARLKAKMMMAADGLEAIARKADGPYQAWLKTGGKVAAPKPISHFTFDTVSTASTNLTTPDSVTTNVAKLVDDPKLVPGHDGKALFFSGDNQVICSRVPEFDRTDTFSFSLWLKPTEKQDRGIVLHQSRAWTDSGSRGFELVLDHGRPFFGLIHFWPGNAAAVCAKNVLPTNEWSHVTVTYDGSSRAAGIRLYVNGTPLETEVVRDNLYKDIVHRKEWGDLEAGKVRFQLAGRFRDSGFKNGAIDDLQIFNTCLTASEVKLVAQGRGETNTTLDYFLARQYAPYQAALSELKTLRQQENALANDIPELMVMQELPQPRPAFLLERGAYDAPGKPVDRVTPVAVMPFPEDQPRNRLGLARWMVDRKNPLTARVVVNRIWRIHFGTGIVASQDDFGSQGSLPSHPELLEWLTGWFIDSGWDVKALHRLIVSSATYQQTSKASRELVERDPGNHLLARGPKQRLQAELIRDSALAASGLLNPAIGGPSVKPYQPAGLWEESGTGKKYTQDTGDKLYRRSLYTFWKRTSPPPNMLTFDAITREVCTAKREVTTTPLQALVLLNDPQFLEASRALAERLLKQHPNDLDARIRGTFRALTGRLPDDRETNVLRQLFNEQKTIYAKAGEADKFLSAGDSPRDKSLPPAEFAAMTSLVSAVMNLDEFVMER